MVCKHCGYTKAENGCACGRCGKINYEGKKMKPVKCPNCGKVQFVLDDQKFCIYCYKNLYKFPEIDQDFFNSIFRGFNDGTAN